MGSVYLEELEIRMDAANFSICTLVLNDERPQFAPVDHAISKDVAIPQIDYKFAKVEDNQIAITSDDSSKNNSKVDDN
ncbi:uncharacterized protein ASCRUDRAFT_8272 [Ascoidea rubescens DSM 1968]|uniref:Uncharacterized protein n=1 Tax=Ascoidea rubescens DSM 1968 TaxID=1344418 RepID=A0A1D2VG95_9ASCO|nr:hypothetical protein ASCRUDRAFT_8272 [Ascoidea rubescens DSM 1968]ODV60655.1 hypothetical protein ASCRUDRAFT_8272 [Ascoidea rubescens DSM 1968]